MSEPSREFLSEIVHARRREVRAARARVPLERLQPEAEARSERRDFPGALAPKGISIIAELKKASPSRGLLRADYEPPSIARSYEQAGAAALSVLTEEEYFAGSLDHLRQARAAVSLPVLRKDFILDPYQVFEAVAAGADALLLIVCILQEKELEDLLRLCRQLRVAALVEVHSEKELTQALEAGTKLVGVNNRDLKAFSVSLETSFRLIERIPDDCLAVSESGIRSGEDVARLREAGFDAVLVGEQLMTAAEPGAALRAMREQASAPVTSRT